MKESFFSKYSLYFAWLLASIGVIINLYISEGLDLEPCDLCWLQRVCLFPLPIILIQAVWKNQRSIVRYVIPLPIIGFFLALTQMIAKKMSLTDISCMEGQFCKLKVVDTAYAVVTVPLASLILFALITLFLFASLERLSTK